MTTATLTAEYTNGTQHAEPILTFNWLLNGRRTFVSSQAVSGKREARTLSAAAGATDWSY